MSDTNNHKALLALLLIGVLMGALDLAIIGPALPAIQKEFGMETRGLAWLFNLYVLGQLVGTPILAKMSDRLGPKAIYITSITLFAVGSMFLVLGKDPIWLFVGRAIQGFGGGGIFPVAARVIGDVFPPEKRGGALGLLGAIFGLAFLIGPVLGGLLLDYGWQWLFLINVPIAIGLVIGAWFMVPGKTHSDNKPFDFGGATSLSLLLTCVAIAITNLDSTKVLASVQTIDVWPYLLGVAVLAPLFWRFETRAVDPVLKPAFFKNQQMRVATLLSLGLGSMQSATAFYPALAVAALGVTESDAAWLLLPGVLCTTVASPVGGFLLNRTGARNLIVFGMVTIVIGFLMFGELDLTTMIFIVASCIAGVGFATAGGAPIRVIMLNEASAEDRGAAQGLLNVSLNTGQLLGAALVGGMTASQGGGAPGYQFSYSVMGVFTFTLLLLSFRLRGRIAEKAANEEAAIKLAAKLAAKESTDSGAAA